MQLIIPSKKEGVIKEIHKKLKKNDAVKEVPKYVWVEKSYIFKFPLKHYSIEHDTLKVNPPKFNMFITGAPFFGFLLIGSFYGVFFKKRLYMEKRVFAFNIMVGFLIILLGNFAYT